MTGLQTPNNLEVLIHCHVTTQTHPRYEAPAVQEAYDFLFSEGLIDRSDRFAGTTEKGKFYLNHLLNIPFPIETYTIPE